MRHEFGNGFSLVREGVSFSAVIAALISFSILDCSGLTPLFLFACVQRRQKRRQAAALQTKKPFHLVTKDGTVTDPNSTCAPGSLFLPSTVLTVSGSRGLRTLPICDCQLPI